MTSASECCNMYKGRIVSSEGFTQKTDCKCGQRKLSQWRGSPHNAVADFVVGPTLFAGRKLQYLCGSER